jgi:hypothetical protein
VNKPADRAGGEEGEMSFAEYTDRYKALGIPYPDQRTMCKGQCEGIGFYPVFDNCSLSPVEACHRAVADLAITGVVNTELDIRLWREAHALAGEHTCDGWHFVKCSECGGTGKAGLSQPPTNTEA